MDKKSMRRPIIWLAIALVAMLGFSALAQGFNTSYGRVQVSRISFDTDMGTLSGLLYLPKGAGADSPRPGVIVTHGYLNSAEMQDANAIELSRRGMVVLALDMYDHGHSVSNADKTGNFVNFWPTSMHDAVQYFYKQPYVLKDKAGNGIIGVTGHSMGGFSSTVAVFMDEQAFAASGVRKIKAALTHGSDYMWTSKLSSFTAIPDITAEVMAKNGGGRSLGKLAAQFDEFFFNADEAPKGTVRKKNFVATSVGRAFLEQSSPDADTWYDTADGGRRIIYQPYEIHPWNHFSASSSGHTIDFYQTAFADYADELKVIPAANQTWLWKELCELAALIAFVLMIVPLSTLLQRLPFLKLAKTQLPAMKPQKKQNALRVLIWVLGILLPAIIFPTAMDKALGGMPFMVYKCLIALCGVVGIALIVLGVKKKARGGAWPGTVLLLASAFLFCLLQFPSFALSRVFPAPTVNQIVYWALLSGLLMLVVLVAEYVLWGGKEGQSWSDYGLKAKPLSVLASLVTSVLAVLIGYALVFLLDTLFVTDLRIWVFAIKTFESSILPIALRYMPFFFVFYLFSSVNIMASTNTEKLQGVKGYLMAILLNAGGIVLYLIAHYGLLFATGTALFPTQSLSSILLFGFVPVLVIAAIFTRALYKRTGNIWTSAFLNTILMSLVSVANTCVFFQR